MKPSLCCGLMLISSSILAGGEVAQPEATSPAAISSPTWRLKELDNVEILQLGDYVQAHATEADGDLASIEMSSSMTDDEITLYLSVPDDHARVSLAISGVFLDVFCSSGSFQATLHHLGTADLVTEFALTSFEDEGWVPLTISQSESELSVGLADGSSVSFENHGKPSFSVVLGDSGENVIAWLNTRVTIDANREQGSAELWRLLPGLITLDRASLGLRGKPRLSHPVEKPELLIVGDDHIQYKLQRAAEGRPSKTIITSPHGQDPVRD